MRNRTAALCTSLVQNHPFVDGNKRVGHSAMATVLMLNGIEIDAMINEQERLIPDLAAGHHSREDVVAWLQGHTRKVEQAPIAGERWANAATELPGLP